MKIGETKIVPYETLASNEAGSAILHLPLTQFWLKLDRRYQAVLLYRLKIMIAPFPENIRTESILLRSLKLYLW